MSYRGGMWWNGWKRGLEWCLVVVGGLWGCKLV